MNAKKKNKKANKPPNPNPPQNLENTSKSKDVENIQPECEVKEEKIPALEVCSEVVETPVSDVKEIESETPKKPKRNKGKKKKQEEEFPESLQQKPQEVQTEPNAKVQDPVQEIVAEDKEIEDKKDPLDEMSVVPSARKKKNKKKSQEPTEKPNIPDEASIPVPVEHVMEATENVDSETKELFSLKPETTKSDPKKKKNKKKNRTDSERSDKSDNVVSCTSAFQKLLVDDETLKQEKTDIMTESQLVANLPLEREGEKKQPTVIGTQLLDEIKEPTNIEPQEIKEVPKDESKGKKKNKKDKKPPQKEVTEDPKPDVPQEIPIIEDVIAQKVPFDKPKQNVKESVKIPLDSKIEKEPSPKPKAKIAKPVEKKRKGKQDDQPSESLPNIESSEILMVENKAADLSKEPKIKLEEIPTVNIIESQISEQTTQESIVIPKIIEKINVPSDSTMGKKRKKSPKPPKNREHNVKEHAEEIPPKIQSENIPEIKESSKTVDLKPAQTLIESSTPADISVKVSDIIPKEMLKPQKEQEIDVTGSKLLERPLTPEIKKDDDGFETKTSKKKKKTPKIPPVEGATEVKEPFVIPVIQKTDDNQEQSKKITEEKIDFPLDLASSADLEVRSVRTNSETSSCDAVPDVLFMRSSSQQLLDGNNNTVIQELRFVEEIKLNDPLLIPFIEGSGETPIRTPELVTSGIRMTEFEAKKPTEEKTDIKSKMIEVNQDMEELRLSIERSLAEFTALEKCEHESEKKLNTKISLKKDKSPIKDNENKAVKVKEAIKTPKTEEHFPVESEAKEPEIPSLISPVEVFKPTETPPVCPSRKDNKGKSKSKKKGKSETAPAATASSESTTSQSKENVKEEQEKQEQKSEQKSESTQKKGKQQSASANVSDSSDKTQDTDSEKPTNLELMPDSTEQSEFEPIEHFEDALTSSVDDVNKTFEMIAKDADDDNIEFQKKLAANKPEINITEATEDTDTKQNKKVNPVSQPKNLLGQNDIPVQSNRTDYKKEKNKTPNARQARVKIKDSMDIEATKQSKESQTDNKKAIKNSDKSVKEAFSKVTNDNDEYVYKYSFRKVFLQSSCHVCNKDLMQVRIPCGYCNLVFYCGAKHKDENWPLHQALCFAVSTLAHIKDQKHIYADAQNATGQDYRLLRMQMIVSCEKVLKRRLVPWEQEAMLYPRICADVSCREWRQGKLKDCSGCGQLSYCADHPEHLPKSHARWCKSYSLYQKLVSYQQTKGRLEPRLPTKVMRQYEIPGKMNEVLAAMYEEKIDMNDIQYAALTQLATAPLTAAHCLQLSQIGTSITNGVYKKKTFTIHVVGAELQFEADALNKWEVFFLHLRPDVEELNVVLISSMLNPGNLPLNLLGRIKLCDDCHQNKRRVVFKFEDNKNYFEYRSSEDFINPDIICTFNPSIQRSSIYNGKDPWSATINSILKLKQPFIVTSYTLNELRKDIARIKEVAEMDFKLISEAKFNSFASVRPDRNFISDDEMPLLFKNYCVAVVLGC